MSLAIFIAPTVVAQRMCRSTAQALLAPISWARWMPVVHSRYSRHSSVVQRTTSISLAGISRLRQAVQRGLDGHLVGLVVRPGHVLAA